MNKIKNGKYYLKIADFLRAAVADPHLLDKIPDGAEIEFLETDLPRIKTFR